MDWSKVSFLEGFLQPAVLKIWGLVIAVGVTMIIFQALLRRAVGAYSKKYLPQRAKTSTLIFVGIIFAILCFVLWRAL